LSSRAAARRFASPFCNYFAPSLVNQFINICPFCKSKVTLPGDSVMELQKGEANRRAAALERN
jgi:hypothetical protein